MPRACERIRKCQNGFSNRALALQLGAPISGLVTAGW
jgi:hypothetical protein